MFTTKPPVIQTGTAEFEQRVRAGRKEPKAPFKRVKKAFEAIRAAMALPHKAMIAAMAVLPEYKSRGHGGGGRTSNRTIDGRWAIDVSKYNPKQCFAEGKR